MSENQPQGAQAQNLVDPNVPADQGLSALGLLMQLGGTVFAAAMSLMLFSTMVAGRMGGEKGILMVVLAASIARSAFHRMAGTELLYGVRSLDGTASPFRGMKRYIAIGLGHSALVAILMVAKFHTPGKFALGIGIGLALWPAALAVMLALPRFKRFTTTLPVAEDKGFEAASILMTVLGMCGVLGTGAILVLMLDKMDALLSQGPGILLLVAMVMLFIRSIFHVQAGLSGLRETSVDRSVELANRYANFGVISAFCASGALLLVMMMGAPHILLIVAVSGICWLLMAWPMIIRRFFSERQFADLLAGDEANLHRRAPDAGLTGLGWLLFGYAMYSACFLLPQVILGAGAFDGGPTEMFGMMGPQITRSMWWNVALVTLQAWAGIELIRMSPHSKMIGTIYAIVASALTIYLTLPILQSFSHMGRRGPGPETILLFIPVAISLVVPVSTLLLVNRKITPTAQARFRTPA